MITVIFRKVIMATGIHEEHLPEFSIHRPIKSTGQEISSRAETNSQPRGRQRGMYSEEVRTRGRGASHLGIKRGSVLSVELLEHGGTRGHDGCEGSRLLRFEGVARG